METSVYIKGVQMIFLTESKIKKLHNIKTIKQKKKKKNCSLRMVRIKYKLILPILKTKNLKNYIIIFYFKY